MDQLSNGFDVMEKFVGGQSLREAPQVAEPVRGPINDHDERAPIEVSPPFRRLTPREQQIVQLLTHGWSNKRIASELFLSQDTIKFHLKASYRKIGVRSRMEAVTVASRLGLVRFP